MGSYYTAFLIGGLICGLGQIFLDNTNYKPAHLLVGLVVLGSLFAAVGWYEPLIKFAGAGVTTPVANFGNVLTIGVLEAVDKEGFMGLLNGLLKVASAGIGASVIIAFFIAALFKPQK